jgi:quinol monooxygenase YgiN
MDRGLTQAEAAEAITHVLRGLAECFFQRSPSCVMCARNDRSSRAVAQDPMKTVEYKTACAAAVMSLCGLVAGCGQTIQQKDVAVLQASSARRSPYEPKKEMMVRLSEIEIHPNYLESYKAILKEESDASVRLEPGVISIFPMYQMDRPSEVRILEIYADRDAYEAHIASPHFQKYKTSTLKMVKTLKLVDMAAIAPAAMKEIFEKLNAQ